MKDYYKEFMNTKKGYPIKVFMGDNTRDLLNSSDKDLTELIYTTGSFID
ncbi:MAG: hypothetical protein HQK79_20745 [Desulfobacterales bacterium]|nr:hypothetical protein [Desulfobacterales bacterium]